jgi:hypothetical protein
VHRSRASRRESLRPDLLGDPRAPLASSERRRTFVGMGEPKDDAPAEGERRPEEDRSAAPPDEDEQEDNNDRYAG